MALRAQMGDATFQNIADGQESILTHSHAGRSSGGQNIAGKQPHVARKICQHFVDGKQHVARVSLLLINRPKNGVWNQQNNKGKIRTIKMIKLQAY